MRKYRDSKETIADILKAARLPSSKFKIMEASNLNIYSIKSYLKTALDSGFLEEADRKYEITEKGASFLKEYLDLTGVKDAETQIDEQETPVIAATTFRRINPEEFYQELKNLGFKTEAAMEIISWIDLIHKKDKFFFSGKKTSVIKACLACNGAILLGTPNNVSRRVIGRFFKVSSHAMQKSYKHYRTLIMEEKSAVLKKTG